MQHYTDVILYKTHQHIMVPISKFLSIFLPYALIIFILGFIEFEAGEIQFSMSVFLQVLFLILGGVLIFAWYYFFWVKSYFIISNEKIIVKVRNGLFSKFHMSIHYKNIRDTAYSKNNILHYMLGYGTFFARSSAGAVGDLEAKAIPHIEKIYRIVNFLHNISESERRDIHSLDDIRETASQASTKTDVEKKSPETHEAATQKEKETLLSIQGIKEVVELSDADRRYIFEHEQERNHGVFECLRRQVLFAATHDSTFRDPDEAIVMQTGERVIFPVVEFHEIKRKKVSSSSPGEEIHEYLVPKFENF